MVEEHEEEIKVEEEEVWVEKASQLLPFLARSLAIIKDYAGVSFECPYLQARLVMVRAD